MNERHLQLSRRELNLLRAACIGHSEGLTDAQVTVQTCWDADRLDLGRVGIVPHPSRLSTVAARQETIIDEAFQRSIRG